MTAPLRFAALASLALLTGCADPVARRADALMQDLHAKGGFTGAVVIAREGEIVYARGFGDADPSRPFAPETAAESGSLAKPVTATATLMLAADGLLDLDQPVQSYLAEFPYADVTARHLLSHAAGLPDYDAFEDLIAEGAPTDNLALLKATAVRRPAAPFPPGTAFEYCNLCYDALAALIARVSGERYEDFIARRIFAPAGMTDTYVRPARLADWPGPRALGYKIRNGVAAPNDVFDNEGFHGGGNINFSARDIARWMMLWADGAAAIPANVKSAALEPAQVAGGSSGITLGNWYCADDRTRCYYTGHHQGFYALSYWDRERRIAVAFISSNSLIAPLQPALARALIAAAEGRAPDKLAFDEAQEEREIDPARIVGAYAADGVGPFRIEINDGSAFLVRADTPRLRLYPVGSNGLYAPGADVYLFADHSTGALRWETALIETPARRSN